MTMGRKITWGVTVSMVAAALIAPASAVAQRETMLPVVKLAGTLDAAGRLCGDYSDADLLKRKQQQKAAAAAQGISAAEFETHFKAAHDKAKAQLLAVTPAKKTQACQQLRAMAGASLPR